MQPLLLDILKINCVIALFAVMYRLLLSKDCHLVARRLYFVCSLLVATAVNFIPSPFAPSVVEVQQSFDPSPAVNTIESTVNSLDVFNGSMLINLIGIVWLSVVIVLSYRLFFALYKIIKYRLSAKQRYFADVRYFETEEVNAPFTFLWWIFIPKDMTLTPEVILHEKAHSKAFHSLDIIFYELFVILFWFNPALWYIRKAAKENLECMADRAVLNSGIDRKEYQYSLLDMHYYTTRNIVASYFNTSQLKTRILMMNKAKSRRATLLKYTAVPLVAVLLSLTADRGITYITAESTIPLYIVNGVEVSQDVIKHISVDGIQEVEVLKNSKAKLMYGTRAKNGVISYTLKDNKPNNYRTQVLDELGLYLDIF